MEDGEYSLVLQRWLTQISGRRWPCNHVLFIHQIKFMYYQLWAENWYFIKEANQINLIYLIVFKFPYAQLNLKILLLLLVVYYASINFHQFCWVQWLRVFIWRMLTKQSVSINLFYVKNVNFEYFQA
jgi:hypothetical protein